MLDHLLMMTIINVMDMLMKVVHFMKNIVNKKELIYMIQILLITPKYHFRGV